MEKWIFVTHVKLFYQKLEIKVKKKLARAKILVVGAGGIGSSLLYYLAAMGIGKIGIIDDDRVEITNLARQILYETADIGRYKTEAAKDALLDLNPEISVEIYKEKFTEQNAKIISNYDLVVEGVDDFASRFVINKACIENKKTLISAAIHQFTGQVAVFKGHEKNSACYRCFCDEVPIIPKNHCADAGVLGASCGIIGSWQALEVAKETLNPAEFSKMLRISMWDSKISNVIIKKDPDCLDCSNATSTK